MESIFQIWCQEDEEGEEEGVEGGVLLQREEAGRLPGKFTVQLVSATWLQAYLEEIKEITEEETKRKDEEVKSQAEETAAEKKAEEETATEKKADDSVEETILVESQAKEIILETTFANPSPTEIQQIVKNEPKPLSEKKED